MNSVFESLTTLSLPQLVSRVQRNHGLEHATLHVLSERFAGTSMGGHSDIGGFWIIGNLSTEDLAEAVKQALGRLRAGQSHLAVHPNCGTNFVTAGVLAGSAALLGMLGAGRSGRDKVERLPLAITFATLALVFAQPLGMRLQQNFTTSGQPGGLEVTEIMLKQSGSVTVHRVSTRG